MQRKAALIYRKTLGNGTFLPNIMVAESATGHNPRTVEILFRSYIKADLINFHIYVKFTCDKSCREKPDPHKRNVTVSLARGNSRFKGKGF